ncbi:MAG: NACHT domain-containing protein [Cyanobacteria bacterium J06638_20]
MSMAGRSLQASAKGIQLIRNVIKRDQWMQNERKDTPDLRTRQSIARLLRGEPVDRRTFEELCRLLGLAVEDIAARGVEAAPGWQRVDLLVGEMRDRLRPFIQEQCGTVQVLHRPQPIDLDAIYTDVDVLETPSAHRDVALDNLLTQVPCDEVEGFRLLQIEEPRIPGMNAIRQQSKLVILGQPGSGKTTFLKSLALQCLRGTLYADRVPLFVSLKAFAEAEGQPSLLAYLERLILPSEKQQIHASTIRPVVPLLRSLLVEGRVLMLLDGLDAVSATHAPFVRYQIKRLAECYPGNSFVISDRIATRDDSLEDFTEVEIADFDDAQIAAASKKWFRHDSEQPDDPKTPDPTPPDPKTPDPTASEQPSDKTNQPSEPTKAEVFLDALKARPHFHDLARSPLFLALLCLVFEASGTFPANQTELYETMVSFLLKKWDVERTLAPNPVHKTLSLRREEDLLSRIAFRMVEADQHFLEQSYLEKHIQGFIRNLPGANTDAHHLKVESQAILKAIAAQHGVLVERARGIYSFSHLAIQGYFAARELQENLLYAPVPGYFIEKRWRHAVQLAVERMPQADRVLQSLKRAIDGQLADNDRCQAFLGWVAEKANTTRADYKPAGLRAFYYALTFDRSFHLDLARTLDSTLARDMDLSRSLTHDLAFSRAVTLARDLDRTLDHTLASARSRVVALALALSHDRALDLAHGLAQSLARDLDFAQARNLDLEVTRDLDEALTHALADNRNLAFAFALDLERALTFALTRARALTRAHDRAIARDLAFALALALVLARDLSQTAADTDETQWRTLINHLEHLRERLPKDVQTRDVLKQWWKDHGKAWANQLQSVMIEYRNIGHDWQFSNAQRAKLENYYEANKLLGDCLNSDGYISREVRQEIEETLLLPIAEIDHYRKNKANKTH